MQDIAVLFKHVDLFNTGNLGNVELLQRRLDFSVVALRGRL